WYKKHEQLKYKISIKENAIEVKENLAPTCTEKRINFYRKSEIAGTKEKNQNKRIKPR
ncbi:hypothetical protein DOY81_003391, partial [Sarcophaga bullata]